MTLFPYIIGRVVRISFVLLCCGGVSACGLAGYGGDRLRSLDATYYVVRSGDTLSSISRRFRVASDQLIRINGLIDPDSIVPGQRLFIAYGGSSAPVQTHLASLDTYDRGSGDGRLAWPLRSGRLVSKFGPRGSSFHDGIDIAAPSGTPVFAAQDGVVLYSGSKLSGYGKLLLIRGDDGLLTVYAHNRRLLVDNGERVSRGEKIAEVGSTGRSSGPHLHFEVRMLDSRKRVVAIDPLPLLQSGASKQRPRYRVNESLNGLLTFLR